MPSTTQYRPRGATGRAARAQHPGEESMYTWAGPLWSETKAPQRKAANLTHEARV